MCVWLGGGTMLWGRAGWQSNRYNSIHDPHECMGYKHQAGRIGGDSQTVYRAETNGATEKAKVV